MSGKGDGEYQWTTFDWSKVLRDRRPPEVDETEARINYMLAAYERGRVEIEDGDDGPREIEA